MTKCSALFFILTQAQSPDRLSSKRLCWDDQWELSNLQQPHHWRLQSRLHIHSDVSFSHAWILLWGCTGHISLCYWNLLEKRNKALYVQYLPRRLRHFNTLVTQREEKKEPSQINVFQEQRNLRHTINARITAGIHSRALWQSWLQADLTAVR